MFMLLILLVVMFRWFILHRFLGTKRMFLFDAVMWTAFAAQNLAAVKFAALDGWSGLNLLMTGLCLWWAYLASKRFLNYEQLVKAANNEQGKGKSDSGTASGS